MNALDAVRCALALKRIAHEHKRQALHYEASGNLKNYRYFKAESDTCLQRAKNYIDFARALS